jgi:hypothetical protein
VFLQRAYPAKFNLSEVFAGTPPSMVTLQRVTESAFDVVRKILEHYQPIDITVDIKKAK